MVSHATKYQKTAKSVARWKQIWKFSKTNMYEHTFFLPYAIISNLTSHKRQKLKNKRRTRHTLSTHAKCTGHTTTFSLLYVRISYEMLCEWANRKYTQPTTTTMMSAELIHFVSLDNNDLCHRFRYFIEFIMCSFHNCYTKSFHPIIYNDKCCRMATITASHHHNQH